MIELLCIFLLFLFVYSYLIYPPLLWCLALVWRRPWPRGDDLPMVSLIISAHNEEAVIAEKVTNALALDYPPDQLEVIVASDGSTDGTDKIVAGLEDSRLILQRYERLGKTACLNRVVETVRGDILLFTDANALFPSDLQEGPDHTGLYARLERWIKERESCVASCVGADGAVFAMRKSHYRALRNSDINDFVLPMQVIRDGARVILDPEVFCYEEPSADARHAFRRQIRITTRTLWALYRHVDFLNPRYFGWFAWFLFSHKVLRLATPWFLLAAFATNLTLIFEALFFMLTFLGLITFYLLAILGLLGKVDNAPTRLARLLLLTFTAQFIGSLRMMVGIEDTIWTPRK